MSYTIESESGIPLLTANSPRASQPAVCGVKLWAHQKAMLARCIEIEQNNCKAQAVVQNTARYMDKSKVPNISPVGIGVMNDPPGSGKTYAALALIAAQPARGLNIIVVPHNILKQWEYAIQTIFPPKCGLRIKFVTSYGDVTSLYGNAESLFRFNIVLVEDSYAEPLFTSINDAAASAKEQGVTSRVVDRLIIDEIDSVQERLYTPIKSNFVWLVSASFIRQGDEAVGPYRFSSTDDIPKIFCKCSPAFVADCMKFEEPEYKTIACEDNEITLFRDLVDEDVMASLNTGDRRLLIRAFEKKPRIAPLTELAAAYEKDLRWRSEDLESLTESIERGDAYGEDEWRLEEWRLQANQLAEFRKKADAMAARLTSFVPSDATKTKEAMFESQIVTEIKALPESKWLIFNDNGGALIDSQRVLERHGIRCIMLDGGSADAIQKAIAAYKKGDVQVLLLNSKMEAAGMNLENTSHLLFMHRTDPRLVEQVMGRAQRFGRVGRLTVVRLLNKNEM